MPAYAHVTPAQLHGGVRITFVVKSGQRTQLFAVRLQGPHLTRCEFAADGLVLDEAMDSCVDGDAVRGIRVVGRISDCSGLGECAEVPSVRTIHKSGSNGASRCVMPGDAEQKGYWS